MNVKNKKTIDIEIEDTKAKKLQLLKAKAIAVLALAVVVFLIFSSISSSVRLRLANAELSALRAQQEQNVAALEQETTDLKTALKAENEALKQQNAALEEAVVALKEQLLKHNVAYPQKLYEGKKLVALTFDDGPGKYTAELLDFFKQNDVRATFFLLGTNAAKYPDLIKRMAAEGHAVGNHSYNHPNMTTLAATGITSQINKCNTAIKNAIGYNSVLFRCPGGNNNAAVKAAAKNANMSIIHWSLDTLDWQLKDKDKIVKRVLNDVGVKDGDIILLHDIHRTSVDATKELVLQLQKEGYTFVTIPELLSARKGGMQAGVVYANGKK